eukprot:TRINITY_DN9118_c0_g1_i2.p1 TRINITY_DN9118_c0_g1~~TRINITY_DN9118_c0_g1_i2.p1  ORF type:complete len:156 (+),score=23.63 TRINITY_DN9118_c0_g1_i2:39-506(+)
MFRSSVLTFPQLFLRNPKPNKVFPRGHKKKIKFTYQRPWEKATTPTDPEPLKFPLQKLPQSENPSGWVEPLGGTEHLPFKVYRTRNKQLPVYSDFRKSGASRLTILRKYGGDVNELKQELSRLLGGAEVIVRPGRMEVKGIHVSDIKLWLKRLGF